MAAIKDPAKKLIIFYLFALFVAIYLLTSSGTIFSDVGLTRLEVVKSIVERFDVSIQDGMGMKGADGRDYSWFSVGSVLLAIPFYFVGKVAGIPPDNAVTIMNQLFAAATVVLIFVFSASLGYSRRASVLTSIFYGLGTMAWYYSKDPGDHVIETFFILLSVYYMYQYAATRRLSALLLSSAFIGIGILTRPTSILVIPPLFLMIMIYSWSDRPFAKVSKKIINDLLLFCLALSPFLLIIAWYNFIRFGSPLETGYGLQAERLNLDFFTGTPLLTGLAGFLTSPGKGFFFYSPIALLYFFSLKPFVRRHPGLAGCFIMTVMTYLLFMSKNVYWHGDSAWGPRYLFVATPYLIIPIAEIFDSPAWLIKVHYRRAVFYLLAISIVIQLAAVSVHPYKYFVWLDQTKKTEFTVAQGNGAQPIIEPSGKTYFNWHLSPIAAQFRFVWEIATSMKNYRYSEPPEKYGGIETMPGMHMFDYWWVYNYHIKHSLSGFFASIALLIYAIYCSIKLRKLVLIDEAPVSVKN